jgi:hypothetical protein
MEQNPSWEADGPSASQENLPHVMEPERSLPHSHQPTNCPDTKTNPLHTPFHFLKNHFNITLPSTPRFFKLSLSLRPKIYYTVFLI